MRKRVYEKSWAAEENMDSAILIMNDQMMN